MNPKENLIKALKHEEPEWVPCPMVDGCIRVIPHSLMERPEESGYDDWGVYWELCNKAGGTFPYKHPIKKPEMVDSFSLPDVEKNDLMKPSLESVSNMNRTEFLLFGDNGWGIFERAWLLTGMDNLLIWMIKEPEAVNILMNKITIVKKRITERFLDEVGVDGIRYGDDWGGEKSLIMSPNFWRNFIKPHQKILYEVCKNKNVLVEQHTDGHIEEIIPDLIEIGLDILNPLQPECNNIEKIKSQFGKYLIFHGGVSSRILEKGSPEEIINEVKTRILQLSYKGGYILSPAHSLPYPPLNLQAFREAAIKYGKIPEKWIKDTENIKKDIEV